MEMLQKSIGFTIENQLFLHHVAIPLTTPTSIFQAMWAKMVFGHNLQHMAPFGIPTSGFCMVFRCATLVFLTSEPILGPQDPDLGSGWAWDPFSQKMGPGKT